MFRRRRPNPLLASFLPIAERLDFAQRSLLAAIPTSRDRGIPLDVALTEFELGLAEAEAALDRWRAEAGEGRYARCRDALGAARAESARLRAVAQPLEFEALNLRIGDVLMPLETFADVERELRRL